MGLHKGDHVQINLLSHSQVVIYKSLFVIYTPYRLLIIVLYKVQIVKVDDEMKVQSCV